MTVDPDWGGLQKRIEGEVVLPGSPDYDAVRKPFVAQFQGVRPQAVVLCESSNDVAETLRLAVRSGLQTATRSGGHCFAGRSSSEGIVIDVTPMGSVSVSDGVATIGAGARLGEVYASLNQRGLTLAAGSCPSVGIAGLTLGGGLGILGRKYGLTSDQLLGAQIVLADGRVVDCDASHDRELFWALRGAGAGNFGVVTSLVFRTHPASPATNFHLTWSFTHAAAVIEAWQEWAPAAPDELFASMLVTASADVERPPTIDLFGSMLGSESDTTELLDKFLARAGADPTSAFHQHMSREETTRYWADLEVTDRDDPGQEETFAARVPLPQVRVLPATPAHGSDQAGAPKPCGRATSRPVPRTGLLPLGRRLQPRPRRRHSFRPSPRAVLTQTRRHRRRRLLERDQSLRPALADRVMEISAALGVRARVSELPRPNPRGLATRLLREELRPVAEGQANLRPGQHLPFPSVPPGHGMNSSRQSRYSAAPDPTRSPRTRSRRGAWKRPTRASPLRLQLTGGNTME